MREKNLHTFANLCHAPVALHQFLSCIAVLAGLHSRLRGHLPIAPIEEELADAWDFASAGEISGLCQVAVTNAADARKTVHLLKSQGWDMVKVYESVMA